MLLPPVQMTFSSLQSEPTESTTYLIYVLCFCCFYMIYQMNIFSIITLPTLPRLHVPSPNPGPSLSKPLVAEGGRRVPQSANHYVLRHSFKPQLSRWLTCLLARSLARSLAHRTSGLLASFACLLAFFYVGTSCFGELHLNTREGP